MINKIKALLSLWKANGIVNKIYRVSELDNGKVECVVDSFNIEPIYLYLLSRILKQKQISLSQINPEKPNRLKFIFEESIDV